MKLWLSILTAMVLISAALPLENEEMLVPMDMQVPTLMKILKYDRNIEERGQQGLTIGVIYLPEDPESQSQHNEFLASFESLRSKRILNLPVNCVSIAGVSNLEEALRTKKVNLIYVTSGLYQHLPLINRISAKNQILSLTGTPEYVDVGIAVGLGVEEGKTKILINLDRSKAEGANFSANLLKLAQVVREVEP
ncbi:YfiR family protein [bacterium]|nr:YfiR family protein [bacterium]